MSNQKKTYAFEQNENDDISEDANFDEEQYNEDEHLLDENDEEQK